MVLTLRQMQQFLAVAETLSFRRAAERLNMAQPPLTAAIRQMERDLGVRLIERGNRVAGLTAAGQVLQEEAGRTVLQAERAVLLTRRAGAGMLGSLRMGFLASATRHFLPPMLARFRASHPDVDLTLVEKPTARQVSALLEDRQDVGIVALPLPPGTETRIAIRTLLHSRFVAAVPSTHALAGDDRPVRLAMLAAEPWVLFPPNEGPGLASTILGACSRAGFSPQIVQQAIQMDTIIGLVAAGVGVSLVPERLPGASHPGVVFRPLIGPGTPIPYKVALAWRIGDLSPVLQAFLASIPDAS